MPRLSKIGAAALAAFGWTSGVSAVTVDFLVVAGGGGSGGALGGNYAGSGGGGAGGYRCSVTGESSGGGASAEAKLTLNPTQSYTVLVGGGGTGVAASSNTGGNGTDSTFSTITSVGGGGSGSSNNNVCNGAVGGSGGASAGRGPATGGAGTANQGFKGGDSSTNQAGAPGGGGAGSAGVNFSGVQDGTNGGNGVSSSITGTSVSRAGGGGGGAGSGTGGTGQAGGGNGSIQNINGTNGNANTGGGAGGAGSSVSNATSGGNGGSGIVIISYVGAQQFGGGVVTSSGGNTIHTFTTSGTLSPLNSLTANFLVVAGGGGGGGGNGGGGAGGLLSGSGLTLDTNSIYAVTVGAGGTAAGASAGGNGGNSSFSMVSTTAVGGGGGGYQGGTTTGASGGSGGGGSYVGSAAGGTGTAGQGNNGGSGIFAAVQYGGGGGGGANAVGANGTSTAGGNGGIGLQNPITGSTTGELSGGIYYLAGGGGGGANTASAGTGGLGGGGAGGINSGVGTAGTPNTGGGGGGGATTGAATFSGGAGGSGVVIISYAGSTQLMAGGTVTVAGGNVIHTFTSSGYLTPIVLVNNSLRFRESASAYLSRTFGSATSTTTGTFSFWMKRGKLSNNYQYIWSASNYDLAYFDASDNLWISYLSNLGYVNTNAVFRDTSAWYHIMIVFDTTNATAANRLQVYVNGVAQSLNWGSTPQTQNATFQRWNVSGYTGDIGDFQFNHTNYFDGYLAEFNFIDGQALTPNSFGTSNGLGVWQPIRYGGSYGTNGFYLPFTNTTSTTTLVADSSPNGNNWTPNNISLTSGSTYDSMTDVPTLTSATTANYAVLNPLAKAFSNGGSGTTSNGNLTITYSATNWYGHKSTIAVSSGKWYYEVTNTTGTSFVMCGISLVTVSAETNAGVYRYRSNGEKINTSYTSYGATWSTAGDICGIAFDLDAGTITFYKNGVSQGTAFTSIPAGEYAAEVIVENGTTANVNFGQRPFAYTPPTGFVALNTYNLPTPTIGATASTTANKYMNVVTWTGNGTSSGRSITGVGFQPDFVWGKARSVGYGHGLYDAVRGTGKLLVSNNTNQEATNFLYGYLSSFDSDGFSTTPGSSSNENWNQTNDTYVAWNWKANGSGSTNTAGSIISSVSANTTSGFSIVTYTGNSTNGATVGHGLLVGGVATAPSMIFVKVRNATARWVVYQKDVITANNQFLELDLPAGVDTSGTNFWTIASINDTTFGLGTNGDTNGSTLNFVAYCFAPVAGYSAFGKYTGNGVSDGPFIYTGFRPRFVMIKASGTTGAWSMTDTSRDPYNLTTNKLEANTALSEASNAGLYQFDILSNGFKIRQGTGYGINNSADYIYMAFAENPFKYANAR